MPTSSPDDQVKNVLDPRVSLVTALHSSPGVYALLIGSGVSTGAGIPTGWGVLRELARKASIASGVDPQEAADLEPDAWWAEHGTDQPFGYSALLGALASTSAARRALLAEFFDATDDDRANGLKVPGPAHRAIAQLVRRGTIRVILTTNFDRLLEQALEAEGILPQVIASSSAIVGMEPLAHARCTVIKLHGDYASLDQLNTEEELSKYDPELHDLLDRVLDEYGLIVSGWSAEWDTALVSHIESIRSRRYPLFWVARSGLSDPARRLVAQHRALVIPEADAETFFPDLITRLEALERMASLPITRSLAITQVKRLVPDAAKHIELRDLFESEVARVVTAIQALPGGAPADSQGWQGFA